MRKKFLITLFGVPFCSWLVLGSSSTQHTDFTEVLSALKAGRSVKAVFHYKDCMLMIDGEQIEKIPDAIGGMEIATWEYFAPGSIGNDKGYIASSHKVLIQHPQHGFVYNYVKLNIFQDNEVKITAKYLMPENLEVKMDESFITLINDGKSGAAYFFTEK
jgi:hypothetical protein